MDRPPGINHDWNGAMSLCGLLVEGKSVTERPPILPDEGGEASDSHLALSYRMNAEGRW